LVARRITPDRILGAQPPPQPARAIPVRRLGGPEGQPVDTAAIQRQFEAIKKRWGLSDVSLRFSQTPLWYGEPQQDGSRLEAAAWYQDGSKTIVFSLPVLKRVYSEIPKGGAAQQYKGGLQDALLVYATGVLDHELSHGLQSQEIAGQQKRQGQGQSAAYGVPPPRLPTGFPHDPRQVQRTNVLNKAELLPLMGRLRQQRLQEDDPTFQKAPELMPMFFGSNAPRGQGRLRPLEPISPLGPTSIGGRGGT
jgi:hypothetical protein